MVRRGDRARRGGEGRVRSVRGGGDLTKVQLFPSFFCDPRPQPQLRGASAPQRRRRRRRKTARCSIHHRAPEASREERRVSRGGARCLLCRSGDFFLLKLTHSCECEKSPRGQIRKETLSREIATPRGAGRTATRDGCASASAASRSGRVVART